MRSSPGAIAWQSPDTACSRRGLSYALACIKNGTLWQVTTRANHSRPPAYSILRVPWALISSHHECCPLHQRWSVHQTVGTIARHPPGITHLPALKCGDVWDIALVNAEGDNLEEVLESPAAVELLHAQPCMAHLDPAIVSQGSCRSCKCCGSAFHVAHAYRKARRVPVYPRIPVSC